MDKKQKIKAFLHPMSKPYVKMKYVALTLSDKREYRIHASKLCGRYAEAMSNNVMDHARDSIYWAYYHLCLEDDKNILAYLEGVPYEFILSSAVPHNTNISMKIDDINKEWNSIKKSIIVLKFEHNKERHSNLIVESQEDTQAVKKIKHMVRIESDSSEKESEEIVDSSEIKTDGVSYAELDDDGYGDYGTRGYK